jgi:hypothetical protein
VGALREKKKGKSKKKRKRNLEKNVNESAWKGSNVLLPACTAVCTIIITFVTTSCRISW